MKNLKFTVEEPLTAQEIMALKAAIEQEFGADDVSIRPFRSRGMSMEDAVVSFLISLSAGATIELSRFVISYLQTRGRKVHIDPDE